MVKKGSQDKIVIGLGFGDEGKGASVDHLTRQESGPVTVVRFNGGGQAAHNVVTDDGQHHTFAQFGSGTLAGANTHLSRFMLFDPHSYVNEYLHLEELGEYDLPERVTVDPRAVVVTPYHKQMNRLREAMREHPHGTCGMGIGEARSYELNHPEDVLRVADMLSPALFRVKLDTLRIRLLTEARELWGDAIPQQFNDIFDWPIRNMADSLRATMPYFTVADDSSWADGRTLIFEGAQGVLLDEDLGFHPHTTWSKTTPDNARTILNELGRPAAKVIGVLRPYATRHGAGPLRTEDAGLTNLLKEAHNGDAGWQGVFRCGWFDSELVRFAVIASGGVDELSVTHADAVARMPYSMIPVAIGTDDDHQPAYGYTPAYTDVAEWVERFVEVPVTTISYGPKTSDRRAVSTGWRMSRSA